MKRGPVVVAATLLLAGCAQQTTTALVPGGPASSPGENGPQAVTTRTVERVLARAPLPRGSKAASAAESRERQPWSRLVDPDLVDRSATYVVPLGFRPAVSWFKANPPAGLKLSEDGDERGPKRAISAGLGFSGASTKAYDSLGEEVSIYPLDNTHTVVRVDAMAIWLRRPTKAERVAANATAVQVKRVTSAGARAQQFTLTGAAVHELASVLNRQRPASMGVMSCPIDNGAYDVLHFTGASSDQTFTVQVAGCGVITVTSNGARQPSLSGGAEVNKTLTGILARPH